MRKQNIIHSFALNNNENTPQCTVNGKAPTNNECSTSERNTLNNNKEYTFEFCIFSKLNGGSSDGGAISFTGNVQQTSMSLKISSSTFSDCSAKEGGAIHASTIQKIIVTQSFFLRCSSSNTADNTGGGGINTENINMKISISNNTFISCTAKASGASIFIHSSSADTMKLDAISNCRFLSCRSLEGTPDGAGVCVWGTEELIGVKDSLFSLCSALYGGAIFYFLNDYWRSTFPIRYCLLNKNSAFWGSDVAICNYIPKTEPDEYALLFHCFSTSDSYRMGYYYSSTWYRTDADWFSLGTVKVKVYLYSHLHVLSMDMQYYH